MCYKDKKQILNVHIWSKVEVQYRKEVQTFYKIPDFGLILFSQLDEINWELMKRLVKNGKLKALMLISLVYKVGPSIMTLDSNIISI